jgi:hypothetical protein
LKMVAIDFYKVPIQFSLLFIALILAVSVFYSLVKTKK